MSELKKYGEVSGTTGRTEFYKFCAALSQPEASEWCIESLSAKLNEHYPTHAVHDSTHKNLWKAARDNLNLLLANKKPSLKRLMFNHPIVTGTIAAVAAGIILAAILPLSKCSGTPASKISPQQQTPESNQPESNQPKNNP